MSLKPKNYYSHCKLPSNTRPIPSSIIKPSKVYLKSLTQYLRYTFLGEDQILPVIISSKHNEEHEVSLVNVLKKKRIKSLGWKISNIRGISLSYCMQKLLIEDGHKPTIERQRRHNPNIQEVMKRKQ